MTKTTDKEARWATLQECPQAPEDDPGHCNHWWDGEKPCCRCGDNTPDEEPTSVIAVDPGDVCGIALFVQNGGPLLALELPAHEALCWVQARLPVSRLVWERFDLGQKTTRVLNPLRAVEVIGVLKWLAEEVGTSTGYWARRVKRVVDDDMLRRAGAYLKTPDGHANDAVRGLIHELHALGVLKELP